MNVRSGPVYWKSPLAGRTTHERAADGGESTATQGETSASGNRHQ